MLRHLPLPANLLPFQSKEVERLRRDIETDVTVTEGVRRWKSNGAVVPPFAYKDGFVECPPEQVAAYESEVARVVSAYRKQRRGRTSTAEERFEMRAAFGPDVEVMDVLTGQRHRT